MTTAAAKRYNLRSAEYLRRARAYLAAGDLEQAAEKGWGAAAVAVKACAESRGMHHNGHRQLWQVVHTLARESDDLELAELFGIAGELHVNFYEDWLEPDVVDRYLLRVEQLTERLVALAEPD